MFCGGVDPEVSWMDEWYVQCWLKDEDRRVVVLWGVLIGCARW